MCVCVCVCVCVCLCVCVCVCDVLFKKKNKKQSKLIITKREDPKQIFVRRACSNICLPPQSPFLFLPCKQIVAFI